jgi:hypothetical protein
VTAAVGGALAALTVDPVVLGALTETLPEAGSASGTPAVFFMITRWDW